MFSECSNSKRQGDVGMAAAIFHYVKLGFTVSVPLTDCQRYDIIIERDGSIKRVQVKTTTQQEPDGFYSVGLRTLGGNQSFHTAKLFDNTVVEQLFILCEDGSMYDIPAQDIEAKSSLKLGAARQQYRV